MIRRILVILILSLSLNTSARADQVELENSDYQIRPYDQITMTSKRADGSFETIVTRLPVLANGHIILERYGEIKIAGLTHKELKALFPKAEFSIYHQNKSIAVIGEVMRPGVFPPENITTIYDAIASAGGFTRLSNKRNVKIVHQYRDGRREIYKINFPKHVFQAYEKGIGEDKYLVHEGDLISVPKSRWKQTQAFVTGLFNTIIQVSTIGLISGSISAAIN